VRALRAFLLGAAALGLIAYTLAAAAAVAAQAAGRELELAAGPLLLVAVRHEAAATETTLGPGLLAVALLGGAANALAAAIVARRSRAPTDRVD
jgi:hypothetical protein